MSGAEKRMQAVARKKLREAAHGAKRAASNAAKTIDDLREFRAHVTTLRASSRTTAEAAAMCRLLDKPPSGWGGLSNKQAAAACPAELTAAIAELVALRSDCDAAWLRRAADGGQQLLDDTAVVSANAAALAAAQEALDAADTRWLNKTLCRGHLLAGQPGVVAAAHERLKLVVGRLRARVLQAFVAGCQAERRAATSTGALATLYERLSHPPGGGWNGLASAQAAATCPAELTAAIGEVVALRACAMASWLQRASLEAREVLPGLAPQDVMGNEQVVALRAALMAVRKREKRYAYGSHGSMPLRGLWLGWHDLDVAEDSV